MKCIMDILRGVGLSYAIICTCTCTLPIQNLLVKPSLTVAEAYAAEMIHFKAVPVCLHVATVHTQSVFVSPHLANSIQVMRR